MTINSIGDLALSFQLRRQNAALRTDLDRYARELSTGISENLSERLKGNYSGIAGLERGISRADSFLVGIAEKRLETSAMQNALEKLRSLGGISGALLTVQETGDPTLVRNAGRDAAQRFEAALLTLNTQAGGRSLFSGIDVDLPAVTDAETMFAAIEAEITGAGAATAADIATIVENWFDVGGGFDLLGYVGGVPASATVRLSDSEVAQSPPTAQDSSLRSFLSALAMGGLVGRGALSNIPTEQGLLARLSGQALVSADSQLVELKAGVGIAEAQVNRAEMEVRFERQALELARSELVAVDPFETVVKLEAAETQLQTLYSVTARLSGLSLANYL